MAEFIRVPSRIINLDLISSIEFEDDRVILHYPSERSLQLTDDDAASLLNQLEERYGLMTHPAARLYQEEEIAA
jgi:hypothetical protein